MKTKVCATCKQELPIEAFQNDGRSSDGLRSYCKNCHGSSRSNKTGNPALASFKPRELIEELRARGYAGKLTYMQEIIL